MRTPAFTLAMPAPRHFASNCPDHDADGDDRDLADLLTHLELDDEDWGEDDDDEDEDEENDDEYEDGEDE